MTAQCAERCICDKNIRVVLALAEGAPTEPPLQVMCCLFTVGLGLWTYNLYVYRDTAHRIHHIMTVLGVFKVLTLLAQCGMYHYVSMTGEPDGWNIAYYIFTFFRGVFLFSVIILIGTGWSYMTPFLGDDNRKVLMMVIPLQVRSSTPLGLEGRGCYLQLAQACWRG